MKYTVSHSNYTPIYYVHSTYWLGEANTIGGCGKVAEVRMKQGAGPSLVTVK